MSKVKQLPFLQKRIVCYMLYNNTIDMLYYENIHLQKYTPSEHFFLIVDKIVPN